jgi:hypothetical protein
MVNVYLLINVYAMKVSAMIPKMTESVYQFAQQVVLTECA